MEQRKYKIRYEYVNPSNAGPFKGSMIVRDKMAKGDMVCAAFGRAEVISCRVINPPAPEALGHHFSTVGASL